MLSLVRHLPLGLLFVLLSLFVPVRAQLQSGRLGVASFIVQTNDSLVLNNTYSALVTLQNKHAPAQPDSSIILTPNNPIGIFYRVQAGGNTGSTQTFTVFTPATTDTLAPGDTLAVPSQSLALSSNAGFAAGGNIIVVWPSGLSVSLNATDTFQTTLVISILSSNADGTPTPTVPVLAFPNPTASVVMLASPNLSISAVSVLSLAGQVLRNEQVAVGTRHHTLDVSHLPQGIYLLQVGLADRTVQTFRIQVE